MRSRRRRDGFSEALLKLAALYLAAGSLIFISVSAVVDSSVRDAFYEAAQGGTGQGIEQAFQAVQQYLWVGRIVRLLLFVAVSCGIAYVTLRPLRQSAERQRNFVAVTSHQLKTPLAVMRTELEVALRKGDALSPERAQQTLRGTLAQVERLSATLQFLMHFASFENRVGYLLNERVPLADVAAKIVAELAPGAAARGVSLAVMAPATSAAAKGNATAVAEAVANLVRNAVQYTPRGGAVSVSVNAVGAQSVALSVRDTGPGIAAEDLPRIFEPFYRGRQSGAAGSDAENLGLGLYMVQQIAQTHRALVRVESTGQGSCFTVEFPVA